MKGSVTTEEKTLEEVNDCITKYRILSEESSKLAVTYLKLLHYWEKEKERIESLILKS